MPNKTNYCAILNQKPEKEWEAYLLDQSGLPGPRANLELVQAAADCGSEAQFQAWLAHSAGQSDSNCPEVFLAVCAAVGLGRLAAEGQNQQIARLRELANDPRWRVREGVAMALQRLGKADFPLLLSVGLEWTNGSLLEARAAAAGICEPVLLHDPRQAEEIFTLLHNATRLLQNAGRRREDDFIALRKGLGYCWSVAIAAYPQTGKAAFEAWLTCPDKDVRWLLRENLKKNRLICVDAKWVTDTTQRLEMD